MKKIIIGAILLGGLIGSNLVSGKEAGWENKEYQILNPIEWNTNEWANWLNNYIEHQLLQVGVIHTPIADIPLGKFLKDVWEGVACKIPVWQGKTQSLNAKIPSTLYIKLPCKVVYIDFTPDIVKMVNKITTKINSYIPDWFEKCIYHPTDPECVKNPYRRYYLLEYRNFDNTYAEGQAKYRYANMTNSQINEEIKRDTKALSQDIFPAITKDGKTAYNPNVLKADLGVMKDAGSSIGKFAYPDKNQAQGLPQNIKTLYAYAVGKQVSREKVIEMFQNRIDNLYQELMAFKNLMDSYCRSDIPATKVIPPSIGGIGGLVDVEKLKKVAINRCCCCDAIPAIHSAEHNVISRISIAEANIVKAIEEASLEIRKTIATEEYYTRVQIHNEFMNYQANEKTYRCMRIKLEYLKLKERLYDMMLKLAILETQYAQLNYKEKEKLIKDSDKYLKKIK